jgi:transcriptional regulator with XRE-family HTH domain
MNVGQIISQLRQEKKLSQKELSKILKLSPSTIGMYEQGRREPDIKTLNNLANYFNTTVDYLTGRTDKPNLEVKEYKNAQFHINKGSNLTEEDFEKALKIIELMKGEDHGKGN